MTRWGAAHRADQASGRLAAATGLMTMPADPGRALRRRPDRRDLRDHPGRPGDRRRWTVLLLIFESLLGAWLVKREGRRAWRALQETLETRPDARASELADAALVLVGGTLLLTPGFVTDVFGFFLVLPFTRPLARRVLGFVVARRIVVRAHRRRPYPPRRAPDLPRRRPLPLSARDANLSGLRCWSSTRQRHAKGAAPIAGRRLVLRVESVVRRTSWPCRPERCRWAGPISPVRSSSSRSDRMSSSSGMERRSSSMSQCVRAGFSTLASGGSSVAPTRLGAAARALPDEGHLGLDSHRDVELVTVGAVIDDALTRGELDPALVLEARAAQA